MNRIHRLAVVLLGWAALSGCTRPSSPPPAAATAARPATPSATSAADARWLASLGARLRHEDGHIVQVDLREAAIDDTVMTRLLTLDTRRWTVLRFSGPDVTDAGLAGLHRLTSLRALGMDDTRISDATLRIVGQLPELVELSCVRAPISDAGLASLRGLDRLRKLRVRGTPITDAALASVADLESLVSLDVSETAVGDGGVASLQGLRKLESLNLWSTQVGNGVQRPWRPSTA